MRIEDSNQGQSAFRALPDRTERERVLRQGSRTLQLGPDVELPLLARMLAGLRPSDLSRLCEGAGQAAERAGRTQVMMNDFGEALDRMLSEGDLPILLDEQDRRLLARRQAGQTVVAWCTPSVDPVFPVRLRPTHDAWLIQAQDGKPEWAERHDTLLAQMDILLAWAHQPGTFIGRVSGGRGDGFGEGGAPGRVDSGAVGSPGARFLPPTRGAPAPQCTAGPWGGGTTARATHDAPRRAGAAPPGGAIRVCQCHAERGDWPPVPSRSVAGRGAVCGL